MMNKQRQKTPQVYGIIGGSLNHSLSPVIHNHFLRRVGLPATYKAFPVDNNNLARAIEGLRILGLSGVNITNPYKERVIPFLDQLARSAQQTGAVNTIENKRGRLIGHNTDIVGIRAVLQNQIHRTLPGKDVVLLGSGGVTRSCLIELSGRRVGSVTVLARTPQKAVKVMATIRKRLNRIAIDIMPWNELDHYLAANQPALVINATSAPLSVMRAIIKRVARSDDRRLPAFFDVNYGRRAVPLNQRPRSVRYIDGLYMLAAQAAESFRLWTGQPLDPKVVYRYARRQLQEN